MIKPSDYGIGQHISAELNDGKVFSGTIIEICYADDTESGTEDSLTVETSEGIFGLYLSEIRMITVR